MDQQYYSFPRLLSSDSIAFVLQPSLFHSNRVPPIIYFDTKSSSESKPPVGLPRCLQNCFKWKISTITPNTIRNCINFMKFDAIRTPSNYYVGAWCKHMLTAEFKDLEYWKKVNHYPGSFHLGRKDKLWSRLRLAVQKFGEHDFGVFHPNTFILPRDHDELRDHWNQSPNKLFIIKPPASARGNGIKVINDISQIPETAVQHNPLSNKKTSMIVQQYISDPCLLENGQKFDLRVYVLLTSVDPLRLYVYDEGLVRFASSKYNSQQDGIIDQYMHLTNYFINKKNQEYQINNDSESLLGCKWTLQTFWRYLKEKRPEVDGQKLWETIEDIIVKTVISCEGPMARLSHNSCKNDYTAYELFGFDIILDKNFKPWILEVNITPSLKSESDLDTKVKHKVIKDMFNLVGYHLPPSTDVTNVQIKELGDCPLFFDERLYTEQLTKKDKLRQAKYQKVFRESVQEAADKSAKEARETKLIKEAGKRTSNNHPVDVKQQKSRDDPWQNGTKELVRSGILDDLTQNDMRVLMLTEDELSRRGNFKRVFPSQSTGKYLKYFDKPRYYDLLLHAWEQRYSSNRLIGIRSLTKSAMFLE